MTTRYCIANLDAGLDETQKSIHTRLAKQLGLQDADISDLTLVRRALDARKKSNIHFVCSYEFTTASPLPDKLISNPAMQLRVIQASALNAPALPVKQPEERHAIVVGAGPAGLFAALELAESGMRVTLLERGQPVESRMRDIGRLRSRGELNTESNICFGEGGAGTYTDGKLYTRIKSPLVRNILHTFVRFGAGHDILIDAHPHLGTDKLVRIVRNMRTHLESLGVDYRFGARVDALLTNSDKNKVCGVRLADSAEIDGDCVVLATGHSARDTYEHLHKLGIHLEAKAFAVGVRAEHPQELINTIQFGPGAGHTALGAAEYAATHQVEDKHLGKRGVYSFCMCPGGLIVPSPTEEGGMAVNGMSNAKRSGPVANSGLVVQVTPEDIERHGIKLDGIEGHPLSGVAFQREIERATFKMAGNQYAAPAMRLTDFVNRKASGTLANCRFKPAAIPTD
ncbi:MAG: FAD-dependent oxidoreductase, partial [Mariprofundaceae bacterium]|nr:FAD-dependent oxidoreductase [Mariprofundaceae bacterium]